MEKLFTIEFADNTSLWATFENNQISYGYVDSGCAKEFRGFLTTVDTNKVCSFVYEFSKKSNLVVKFTDHVQEKSDELQKQLLKAC